MALNIGGSIFLVLLLPFWLKVCAGKFRRLHLNGSATQCWFCFAHCSSWKPNPSELWHVLRWTSCKGVGDEGEDKCTGQINAKMVTWESLWAKLELGSWSLRGLYAFLLLLDGFSKHCPYLMSLTIACLQDVLMTSDYRDEQYFPAKQSFSQNILTFIPVSPWASKPLSVEFF